MELESLDTEPSKAPTISRAEWEKYKPDIERIYVEERKSFKHLVRAMKLKGLNAR